MTNQLSKHELFKLNTAAFAKQIELNHETTLICLHRKLSGKYREIFIKLEAFFF